MKSIYVCLLCIVFTLCSPLEFVDAQEIQPPTWFVGNWWIVKSQVYDSGKIVAGATPGWLPPQTWRFDVEKQDSIANQSYFVVAIHPVEDNPCPYWFRYWFRVSDRYVGRYELHHPKTTSRTTKSLGPSVVRKNFSPDDAAPFFTTKFPALPLTVPLFGIAGNRTTFAAKESTAQAVTSTYTRPEFETIQEIQNIDAETLSKKANQDFLKSLDGISNGGNTLITIQTKSFLKEVQHWDPELPWCVYGERTENSIVSRRYWLVGVSNN